MHIPLVTSITDLFSWELWNSGVAFKGLPENLGEIYDQKGDGNCGHYAIFEAFSFLGKDLAGKNLHLSAKILSCKNKKNRIGQIWENECGSLCMPPQQKRLLYIFRFAV